MTLPGPTHTTRFRLTIGLVVAVAAGCAGCEGDRPTAPSAVPSTPAVSAAPTGPSISGTVWLHSADGVKPFANGSVFGWIESGTSGRTTGPVPTDTNGRYMFSAPPGSRVRIHISGSAYQPCAVTLNVPGDVTRDIHAVDDRLQLGARLPSQLLADRPTLSGVVFDIEEGRQRPLADVRVELDGLFGLGLVTATTLTDADGRYVLCGLGGEASTVIFASKTGYRLFEKTTGLIGDTSLDIELQR